ncbi:hypothetical protein [Meridianimarinicoccus roseus]|nr:hypothetical protein [Meridianimarinicoccus roseus]
MICTRSRGPPPIIMPICKNSAKHRKVPTVRTGTEVVRRLGQVTTQ